MTKRSKDKDKIILIPIEDMNDDISDVRWIDAPAILIFLLLLSLVGAQFFTRYILNDSLGWTEEISRYCLILLGFVGAIICIRKGTHIQLDFFYRYMPRSFIKPIAMTSQAITSIFFAWLGYLGLQLANKTRMQSMSSLSLPKALIYDTITVACFLMAIFACIRLWHMKGQPAVLIASQKRGTPIDHM